MNSGLIYLLLEFYSRVLWCVQLFNNSLYHELLEKLRHHILLVYFWEFFLLQSFLFQLFQRVWPLFHLLGGVSITHYHMCYDITILLGYLLFVLRFQFQTILILLHLGFYCVVWNMLPDITNLWSFLIRLGYFHYLSHSLLIWPWYLHPSYTIRF